MGIGYGCVGLVCFGVVFVVLVDVVEMGGLVEQVVGEVYYCVWIVVCVVVQVDYQCLGVVQQVECVGYVQVGVVGVIELVQVDVVEVVLQVFGFCQFEVEVYLFDVFVGLFCCVWFLFWCLCWYCLFDVVNFQMFVVVGFVQYGGEFFGEIFCVVDVVEVVVVQFGQ